MAEAYDRWLMNQGKPQKYGTQFVPDGVKWFLGKPILIQRMSKGQKVNVPTIAHQHNVAKELTKTDSQPNMNNAPDWLKDAIKNWKNK